MKKLENIIDNIKDEKIEEALKLPVWVCLLKIDDKYYVMCEGNGCIMGFENLQKAVEFWDIPYENTFRRGLCAVTGATLLHIRTMPKIVFFNSQKEMIESLFIKPPFNSIEIQFNYAIECQKDVKEIYDIGYEIELFKKLI